MSRVGRVVVAGFPHHVTQRGNRRADVFESDGDREAYLCFLRKYADRHGLAVWAYCLMTNHVHLVVVPQREESLGLALRDAHTVYAMYFNTRTRETGHVWQGRFHSCPLDDPHLWAAVRYVERNPVRAGLVAHAEDYRWSSARNHCGLAADALLEGLTPSFAKRSGAKHGVCPGPVKTSATDEGIDPCSGAEKRSGSQTRMSLPPEIAEDWSAWLAQCDDDATTQCIRQKTHTGRPCGSTTFVEQLERLVGRVLQPAKRGRKAKAAPQNGAIVGSVDGRLKS